MVYFVAIIISGVDMYMHLIHVAYSCINDLFFSRCFNKTL